MDSPKNWHIQAGRLGKCSAFQQELSVAWSKMASCLGLKVLDTSLFPPLSLSNGLKITLSIIPIAVSHPRVEITHG